MGGGLHVYESPPPKKISPLLHASLSEDNYHAVNPTGGKRRFNPLEMIGF